MKRKPLSWWTLSLLTLVALSVQGCLGLGSSSKPNQVTNSFHGQQVSVSQDSFKGKFYLTIGGNLYVINGNNTTQELVNTGNVSDPAVSPDGKWVAFIQKYKQYSDLSVISTAGGDVKVLRSGNGQFYTNDGGFIHNTFYWYAQPAWSPDSANVLFLSDFEKEKWYATTQQDAPFLDLQVLSVPFDDPTAKPTDIAYASFGDGGNRDVSYRPGHPDQIIYTHYTYDPNTRVDQQIQLFMENPNTISEHPGVYYPGPPGGGYDPSVAITDTNSDKTQAIQPAFSPDGNTIAYIKRTTGATQMELDLMPCPPDNITANPNDAASQKQALDAFQNHSTHLLSELYIQQPVWSPDGKQLAYYTYTNNQFDLWLINLNYDAKTGAYTIKGSPIQITSTGVDGASRPVWTN